MSYSADGAADPALVEADTAHLGQQRRDGRLHAVRHSRPAVEHQQRFPVRPALAYGERRPRPLDHELRHPPEPALSGAALPVAKVPCVDRTTHGAGGIVRQGADSGGATATGFLTPGIHAGRVGPGQNVPCEGRKPISSARPNARQSCGSHAHHDADPRRSMMGPVGRTPQARHGLRLRNLRAYPERRGELSAAKSDLNGVVRASGRREHGARAGSRSSVVRCGRCAGRLIAEGAGQCTQVGVGSVQACGPQGPPGYALPGRCQPRGGRDVAACCS